MVYDDLDRHLAAAGSIERAAVPMGMFLAWCVNLNLISSDLLDAAEESILRLRYREITGSELLLRGCGGTLDSRWFSEAGVAFCDRYYARYLDDYREVFGDAIYDVKDDWAHYDRLAPLLTEHLFGRKKARGKAWWQFWR